MASLLTVYRVSGFQQPSNPYDDGPRNRERSTLIARSPVPVFSFAESCEKSPWRPDRISPSSNHLRASFPSRPHFFDSSFSPNRLTSSICEASIGSHVALRSPLSTQQPFTLVILMAISSFHSARFSSYTAQFLSIPMSVAGALHFDVGFILHLTTGYYIGVNVSNLLPSFAFPGDSAGANLFPWHRQALCDTPLKSAGFGDPRLNVL